MKRYLAFLIVPLFLLACENLVKSKEARNESTKKTEQTDNDVDEEEDKPKTKKKTSQEQLQTNSDADILNNIIVNEKGGLTVSRAFLSFEDGKLVPKNNRVPLREPVYLNLVIERGFEEREGEVSLDASEKIETNTGELVLNAPSLFKSMPVIEAEKANNIYLKATINRTRSDIDYFIVNYRVWDKWGKGEVKGHYKLYIDDSQE